MSGKIYTIKEASELLELESHTLRYYEDELELDIPRNSMGHRYYSERDIEVFRQIMILKDQGLQLKAIKEAIQEGIDEAVVTTDYKPLTNKNIDITDTRNPKVQQFQLMMKETFIQAAYENQEQLRSELNSHIKYRIEEELKDGIQRLEDKYEEKDKERYKKIDETMREMQKMRRELAEMKELKKEKKTLFGKIFAKKDVESNTEECNILQ